MSFLAEYIWLDGTEPVARLRSKTKVVGGYAGCLVYPVDLLEIPVWGFDGSSTNQAAGASSDCILKPVRVVKDPLRRDPLQDGLLYDALRPNRINYCGAGSVLVLCEVLDSKGEPVKSNKRAHAAEITKQFESEEPFFGIEQEYTFFKGRNPLGWPEGGYPAPQGPFYCGVGADEVFGREIVEEHMKACLKAGLKLSGVNAEVMPGQWEFQIGPGDPLLVSDHLWLARYLLYRIAEKHGVNVKLDPKPVGGDWNGAGAHTNFSTKDMRTFFSPMHEDVKAFGLIKCKEGCEKLKEAFEKDGFPEVYGYGHELRLTGAHETCSHGEFKYGIGDRTASVRIPLHVANNGYGYIEDRRPCANIDPYEVCAFVMSTICG